MSGADEDRAWFACGACGQPVYEDEGEHDCDLDPANEIPAPVVAIAEHWGGAETKITEVHNGVWTFTADEGMSLYTVHAPWLKWPAFEDSGRPAGGGRCAGFHVRPEYDAPDSHFEVPADGRYVDYRGEVTLLW